MNSKSIQITDCCKSACIKDLLELPMSCKNNNEVFINKFNAKVIYYTWNTPKRDTVSVISTNNNEVQCVLSPWKDVHQKITDNFLRIDGSINKDSNGFLIANIKSAIYIPTNANWYHWLVDSFAYLLSQFKRQPESLRNRKILFGVTESYQKEIIYDFIESTDIDIDLVILPADKKNTTMIVNIEDCLIPNILIPVSDRLKVVQEFFLKRRKDIKSGSKYNPKKVAIVRNNCSRLANQEDIYRALVKADYEILNPSKLNFHEKLEAFSNCKKLFIPVGSDRCHFQTLCDKDTKSTFLVPESMITNDENWILGAWRYWYKEFERTEFIRSEKDSNLSDMQRNSLEIEQAYNYNVDEIMAHS